MLRNARDPERRVLCPTCGKPIVDEDVIPIDRLAYHRACCSFGMLSRLTERRNTDAQG